MPEGGREQPPVRRAVLCGGGLRNRWAGARRLLRSIHLLLPPSSLLHPTWPVCLPRRPVAVGTLEPDWAPAAGTGQSGGGGGQEHPVPAGQQLTCLEQRPGRPGPPGTPGLGRVPGCRPRELPFAPAGAGMRPGIQRDGPRWGGRLRRDNWQAGRVLPVPLRHKLLSGQACGPRRLAGVTCN